MTKSSSTISPSPFKHGKKLHMITYIKMGRRDKSERKVLIQLEIFAERLDMSG
jgi:hypothetical protein